MQGVGKGEIPFPNEHVTIGCDTRIATILNITVYCMIGFLNCNTRKLLSCYLCQWHYFPGPKVLHDTLPGQQMGHFTIQQIAA